MKNLILSLLMCVSSLATAEEIGMPVLHQIKRVTLSTPYSCGGNYLTSALFITEYSKLRNSPDLLYDGACRSANSLRATTAGDDFTLISDLGNVPLESVSASKVFNLRGVVGAENGFKETQYVQSGHTYAVLLSKSSIRALYVFRVISHEQGGPLAIEYAVKSYAVQSTVAQSAGFNWDIGNSRAHEENCTTKWGP